MAISASARHHLFRKLEDLLGPEDATTLMDSLPSGGWEHLATKDDVRAETTVLRSEMATLGAELRQEMAALGAELRQEMATKADLRDLERRIIEHVDMRVDARMAASQRSTIAWMMAMNATMLTAVIAAIRL